MPDDKDDIKDKGLAGRRKAAAFLLSLDSETAAVVMQRMSDRDVALVSEEITKNLYALHDQAGAAGDIAKENDRLSNDIRQLSDTLFGLVGKFKIS